MSRRLVVVPAAVLALTAVACGGSAPQPESQAPAATAAPASHEGGHTGARVFFKEPANGAMVKSPVHVVFGSDMFTIAAVPEGEVKEVRAGTGHYHLGVDTDCLPVGTPIPKADPWIHFGKGNDFIDMQFKPGPHKLVVQAGDDLHTTLTGLCETISITVTE
jgi:hypothetical protein